MPCELRHAGVAIASLALAWLMWPGYAADIAASDNGAILVTGRIQSGDDATFQSALVRLSGREPLEVSLDSVGGLLQPALKIAEMVRAAGLTTRVPNKAICASACALIFAAGARRVAGRESKIGVHSVGLPNPYRDRREVEQVLLESESSLAITTRLARAMAQYGTPPVVIAKLVTTPTDKVSFLSAEDLGTWGVTIAGDVPGKEIPTAANPLQPLVPAPAPSSSSTVASPGRQVKTEPIQVPPTRFDPNVTTRFQPSLAPSQTDASTKRGQEGAPHRSPGQEPKSVQTSTIKLPLSWSRMDVSDFARAMPGVRIGRVETADPARSQLPSDGPYVVQVSAQKTEGEARASYQALRLKYRAVLGGREAIIRRVDLGAQGVFYRAYIGPFATAYQANEFCGDLQAAGGRCVVQKN